MEDLNLSHPFSRRNTSYAAANAAGKSVYDDVFGGAPKFGLTSLAPRLQDYTEIFCGFHSSRGSSSIPVLDLPTVDDDYDFIADDVEIGNSRFDYSEVFGGLNGVDFAVSFEDLVNEANGGYDSSDEAWSPANSGSLSGETDPSACSEGSQSCTNADIDQSLNDIMHFSVSYHKAHQRSNENLSNGMAHVAHLHAVPGYTCVVDETSVSQKVESEKKPHKLSNDLSHDFEERVTEEKRFNKSMSLPMNTGLRRHENYLNPSEKNSKSGPITQAPLLTVSDISLRTKPSQLPPPSRPPPVLAVRKGEPGKAYSKLKGSKSYAFERVASDKLPPFFDVELERYSSASTIKDAVEKTQSELRSTEEGTEGKMEDLQSGTNLQMEDDIIVMEQNMTKTFDKCNSFVGDRLQGTRTKEGSGVETSAEERERFTKTSEMVADGTDREIHVNLFENSAESKRERTCATSQGSYRSEETVAWREEAEFFEVETDNSWMSFKQVKAENISKQDVESPENWPCVNTTREPIEQDKNYNKINPANEAPEWEVDYNQRKVADSSSRWIGDERRSRTTTGSSSQPENQKNGLVNGSINASETHGEKLHMAQHHGEVGKPLDKNKNVENLKGANKDCSLLESKQVEGASERRGKKKNVKDANSREEYEMRAEEVSLREDCEGRKENATEQVEYEKKEKERPEQDQREKQQTEFWERERKKKVQEAFEREENEIGRREALEPMDGKGLKDNIQLESTENIGKMDFANEDSQREHKVILNSEEYEEMLRESSGQEETEVGLEESPDQDTGKIQCVNHVSGRKDYDLRPKEIMEQESKKNSSSLSSKEEQSEKQFKEANGLETIEHVTNSVGKDVEFNQTTGNKEHIQRNVGTEGGNLTMSDNTCQFSQSIYATHLAVKQDKSEACPCESNDKLKIEIQGIEEESEDQLANLQFEKRFNSLVKDEGVLQHKGQETRTEAVKDFPGVQEHLIKPNQVCTSSENPPTREVKVVSCPNDLDNRMVITPEVPRGAKVGGVQFTVDKGVTGEKFTMHQVVRDWVDNAKKIGDALQAVLEDIGDLANTDQTGTTEGTETKERSRNGISLPKEPKIEKQMKKDREMDRGLFGTTEDKRERQREREKDLMVEKQRVGERLKERELENDLLKRIKEEREREREKDRMAMDSAIREARDRSYANARERAAVERANAEVRQRAMAEARERLEKASVEAREARLRAERAAVERATAEARQRAFGKAMAEKAHVEGRERLRTMEMKQSTSSSDSQDIRFQSTGTSSGFRYTYSSAHVGVEGESPQRCKARLERYQRTAERAAKALAEKNMRDLVAQREQEERNRLAEILDAEVRRWSSGKEGNLRALLSTLQYILGPESGWQPIPLTEVITSAAVKRAYRKATLCVHPDKLQQRGANVQQKYICEKVFDLLKDAWNKFNSEER